MKNQYFTTFGHPNHLHQGKHNFRCKYQIWQYPEQRSSEACPHRAMYTQNNPLLVLWAGFPGLYEKDIPWVFPERVSKFHEKYFPFNAVAGKSRSGSSTAHCYCLERCVIFTKATITSQSMNTIWTHGTRHTYQGTPNWRKPFPSGSLSQIPWVFPDFLCFSQIPWVFPDWKIGNSFSRFSLLSRVAGNPGGVWRTKMMHTTPALKSIP